MPRRFAPGEAAASQTPAASKILTSLLVCLGANSDSEGVETDREKTLKLHFVIQQDADGEHKLKKLLKGEHDDMRSAMMSFLSLAKAVGKERDVEVELELMHEGHSMGKLIY